MKVSAIRDPDEKVKELLEQLRSEHPEIPIDESIVQKMLEDPQIQAELEE